jgi:hypothetical protein
MAQINIVFFLSSTCPKDNTNSKKKKQNSAVDKWKDD